MKPLYAAWLIQIEVTNACRLKCAHCTRAVPHFKKPFFADLGFIEKVLQSLKDWHGGIGCMGGEPTLHPKFAEICALYKKYVPRKRSGLWTSGGPRYEKFKKLINETFGIINFNDHEFNCYHQPIMIASEELIKDEKLTE